MKLIRICSFIFRFLNNTQHRGKSHTQLTGSEFQSSIRFLVKRTQECKFAPELAALRKGQTVPSSCKLKALNPFLDKNGLLRVGGRLINSNLLFDAKHQLILPSDDKLTKLIFEYFYKKKYLHIYAQGLVHQIRRQCWPIKVEGIARKIVHSCITCFSHNHKALEQ